MGNNNSGNANHAFRINNNTGSAYGKRKEPMFIGRENTNSNSQGITNLNSVNSNPNLNLQTQANSSKHVMLGIEGTETSEIRGHSFDRIRQNSNSNAQYPNGQNNILGYTSKHKEDLNDIHDIMKRIKLSDNQAISNLIPTRQNQNTTNNMIIQNNIVNIVNNQYYTNNPVYFTIITLHKINLNNFY